MSFSHRGHCFIYLMCLNFIVRLMSLISDGNLIIVMYLICLNSVMFLIQSHRLITSSHIITITCHV